MAREFASVQNWVQIRKLIEVLTREMVPSPQSSVRKGGLTGLASLSIGLGKVGFLTHQEGCIISC